MKLHEQNFGIILELYITEKYRENSDIMLGHAFSQANIFKQVIEFVEEEFPDHIVLVAIARSHLEYPDEWGYLTQIIQASISFNEDSNTFDFNREEAMKAAEIIRSNIAKKGDTRSIYERNVNLSIEVKYSRGILKDYTHWLIETDIEKMLTITGMRDRVKIATLDSVNFGNMLCFEREKNINANANYSIPFIMNRGGGHWVAGIIRVNPIDHTVSYKIIDSTEPPKDKDPKAAIREIIRNAIGYNEITETRNFIAFPEPEWKIIEHDDDIIYESMQIHDSHSCGYRALKTIFNFPELAAVVNDNAIAKEYAQCPSGPKDSLALVKRFYQFLLSDVATEEEVVDKIVVASHVDKFERALNILLHPKKKNKSRLKEAKKIIKENAHLLNMPHYQEINNPLRKIIASSSLYYKDKEFIQAVLPQDNYLLFKNFIENEQENPNAIKICWQNANEDQRTEIFEDILSNPEKWGLSENNLIEWFWNIQSTQDLQHEFIKNLLENHDDMLRNKGMSLLADLSDNTFIALLEENNSELLDLFQEDSNMDIIGKYIDIKARLNDDEIDGDIVLKYTTYIIDKMITENKKYLNPDTINYLIDNLPLSSSLSNQSNTENNQMINRIKSLLKNNLKYVLINLPYEGDEIAVQKRKIVLESIQGVLAEDLSGPDKLNRLFESVKHILEVKPKEGIRINRGTGGYFWLGLFKGIKNPLDHRVSRSKTETNAIQLYNTLKELIEKQKPVKVMGEKSRRRNTRA